MMHWVLLLAALAAVGGVVWLLVQRGGTAARVAVAEGEAKTERERRSQVEGLLEVRSAELKAMGDLLAKAQASVAGLEASLKAELAGREKDRRDAAETLRVAVESEGRTWAQRSKGQQEVYEAEMKALEKAKAEIDARLAAFDAKMKESFGSLAGEALSKSNAEFLKLAEQRLTTEREKTTGEVKNDKTAIAAMLDPIRETLKRTDERLGKVQEQWAADKGTLSEQLRAYGAAGESLRTETGKLVKALSRPEVRGRYGEIQLRRVAELAGMSAYCDFAEQESTRDGENRVTRPDMVVKLPNDRIIAVDAKTNTYAYVEAINAVSDEERSGHLDRFARHVAEQVDQLSKKQYWTKYEHSPDFVVMFMPGDQFLDAALERRPDLIESAAAANVLLATPATLIGLLRAVAVGWREKRLDEQAKELFELGKQLHERAATAFEKLAQVGKAIESAASKYNDFVGSYEGRLEPTLRRFEEAGVRSAKTLVPVVRIDTRLRELPAAGGGEA